MNTVTYMYTIGPVNIDVHYYGILMKQEPKQVLEFRRNQNKEANLVCNVRVYNGDPTSVEENISTVLFVDDSGIKISRSNNFIIFEYEIDEIGYIKKMKYDLKNDICDIYVISNEISQLAPHLLETTQMQFVLMQYLQNKKGFLLHSSAIDIGNDEAYCFTGYSGAGKSTISHLFAQEGYRIITDETCIIWIEKDEVFVSGTPWKGSETFYFNKKICRLKKVFVIGHGQNNTYKRMALKPAVDRILKQTFPHFWDMASIRKMAFSVVSVLSHIEVGEYLFLPDSSAVFELMK